MRLPFLRPKSPDQPGQPEKPERKRRAVPADAPAAVDAARARARRRLVGALVLLLIGIVGFPILFETRPRPLPVDTPIEIAQRGPDTAPVAAGRPQSERRSSAGSVDEGSVGRQALPPQPAPAPAASTPAATATATSPVMIPSAPAPTPLPTLAVAPIPAAPAAAKPKPAPVPAPAAEPVTKPSTAPAAPSRADDAARARALLEGATPAVEAAPTAGRFVVQVGAFSDAATLRDARAKVEKLGLKTYTQVIANDAGKRTRVRVGPFASRDEADAAAAKVRRGGLPAAVLTL